MGSNFGCIRRGERDYSGFGRYDCNRCTVPNSSDMLFPSSGWGIQMQTQQMGVIEHRETASKFLQEADEFFEQGDDLQGAEKMWGAAAHAVIAVCQQRGWRHRSHPAMSEAVVRLSAELREAGDERTPVILDAGFVAAASAHVHFYHRDMDLEGGNGQYFERAKRLVEQFVERMVAISESLDSA